MGPIQLWMAVVSWWGGNKDLNVKEASKSKHNSYKGRGFVFSMHIHLIFPQLCIIICPQSQWLIIVSIYFSCSQTWKSVVTVYLTLGFGLGSLLLHGAPHSLEDSSYSDYVLPNSGRQGHQRPSQSTEAHVRSLLAACLPKVHWLAWVTHHTQHQGDNSTSSKGKSHKVRGPRCRHTILKREGEE